MKKSARYSAIASALCLCPCAFAGITFFSNPDPEHIHLSSSGSNSTFSAEIVVDVGYSGGIIGIEMTAATGDTVPSIGITNNSTAVLELIIHGAGGSFNTILEVGAVDAFRAGAESVGPVTIVRLVCVTLGSVRANDIGLVAATHILQTGIEAVPISGAETADITSVFIGRDNDFGHSAAGYVKAEDGKIAKINMINGTLGSSGTPLVIRARDGIGWVGNTGTGAIYVDIDAISGGSAPNLRRLSTNSGGTIGGTVNIETFIDTIGEFAPGIYAVGGPLAATVRMNGAFPSIADIVLEENGLTGQIIINGAGGSSWSGDVIVDSVTLTPTPHYSNVGQADIGPGAVGHVPYSIHPTDCEPDDGDTLFEVPTQTWTTSPTTRETIVLSHYGPVIDSLPGSTNPVKVERQSLVCEFGQPCPPDWEDITSSCTVLMGQGTNDRDLWICVTPIEEAAQSFGTVYLIRVTPQVAGGVTDLRSDDTLQTTAPNVYAYTYDLTLAADSFGAATGGSEYLSFEALEAWLAAPTDITGDSVADDDDVEFVLERMGLD